MGKENPIQVVYPHGPDLVHKKRGLLIFHGPKIDPPSTIEEEISGLGLEEETIPLAHIQGDKTIDPGTRGKRKEKDQGQAEEVQSRFLQLPFLPDI